MWSRIKSPTVRERVQERCQQGYEKLAEMSEPSPGCSYGGGGTLTASRTRVSNRATVAESQWRHGGR